MERAHAREPPSLSMLAAAIFVSCAVSAILACHRKARSSRGHWQRSCNFSGHPRNLRGEVEGNMKMQNRIRMQMVMVGLGAALLMAGSARGQQDMDPTYFDINPGTPAVQKAAVVRSAQNYIPAKTEGNDATSALAVASGEDATLEAGMTRVAVIDAGIALILFGGIVSIVLYAMAATRRERALRVSAVSAPYTP